MTRHAFVPARPLAPVISRKKKGDDKSECPHCQKKARVSEPGDPLEHEADRAADAAMNHKPVPAIPTKKLDGTAPLQRKAQVQRHAQRDDASAPAAEDTVREAVEGHGTALDPATLEFMQERFGRDFSHVRIHTGTQGERAAEAVDARAFTQGRHVVFNRGEYRPGTLSGKQLIAHELAHVAQQGAAPLRTSSRGLPAVRAPSGPATGVAPPISMAPPSTISRLPPVPTPGDITIPATGEMPQLDVHIDPNADEASRGAGPFNRSFDVSMLTVPKAKGVDDEVKDLYTRFAKSHGLRATVGKLDTARPNIAAKQPRDPPEQLRDRWLDRIGWPRDVSVAAKYWKDAGGDDGSFYYANKQQCQTDHIIELQLGGDNTRENLRPLDGAKNTLAGSTLWSELSAMAKAIKADDHFGGRKAKEIELSFGAITMGGSTIATRTTGGKPTCLGVMDRALTTKVSAADKAKDGSDAYEIKTKGGRQTTLRVPGGFAKRKTGESIALVEYDNAGAVTILPGFVLKTLTRGKGKTDTLAAALDERTSARLPLTFGAARAKWAASSSDAPFSFNVNTDSRLLAPYEPKSAKAAGIPIDYRFMSPGAITSLTLTDDGVEFKGYINPSLPFLKKLDITYEKGVLAVSKTLVPADYKLPIPGARVTRADIAIILAPELKAQGTLGLSYSAGKRKVMEGELKATVDSTGFRLGGVVNVFIPGVDNATATFEYTKEAGWSGNGKVELADLQKKLKYVKSGEVGIGFRQGKGGTVDIEATGKVLLDIPHTRGVEVSLTTNREGWKFKGKGIFNVPKLKPVDIAIEYDGEHMSGEAKGIGFKYKSFDATIDLRYRDEKFSGDGTVHFEKGRASGELKIHLLPTGRFTGEGSLTFAIREGIEATAAVSLDEKEKLHVDGKLAFAKPIKLFEGFKGDATILKVGVSIPIPGLSVGVVGINARIEGQLDAGYQIGPGEIRNASAEAQFDPLEDDPNLSIEVKGQIWIGASAYIKGSISGLIEISVGIAAISGGLKMSATATLQGEILSNVSLFYAKGRYEAKADFAASLALAIRLALEAVVKAEAGVGPFKIATERDWTLAAKEFNTGLKLGIRVTKPLSYASDTGLDVPAASDIEVTKPDLDPGKLIDNVMGASSPKDTPL